MTMRFCILVGLLSSATYGFVPTSTKFLGGARRLSSGLSFGINPSKFNTFGDVFSSFSIADASPELADALTSVTPTPEVVQAATEVVKDDGWFGFLTGPTESLLIGIHGVVDSLGTGNSWGLSIILLTLLIKVVTFPLTKTQLESTNKMQAMQPAIKELQQKYQSNPEVMNQKIAEFYQVNEINPLAGCIPSLVQIPVFIGLYRAVLDLAAEDKLNEPFLFLPSLEGPTYGADPTSGSDWILKGWVDGAPSLGWDDTLAFLVLPIFLVVSQFISMELMQPKTDDPAQQQSNAILKALPLLIGWFSLNVPSALCVYWLVNNIVTTATSLIIRSTMPKVAIASPGATTMPPPPPTIFAPPREKPSGFADRAPTVNKDAVRPITTVDVEIVREKKEEKADAVEGEPMKKEAVDGSGKKRRSGKKKRKD